MHQIAELSGKHYIVSIENDIRNWPHKPKTLGDALKHAILNRLKLGHALLERSHHVAKIGFSSVVKQAPCLDG